MLEHSAGGALGLVINNPSQTTIKRFSDSQDILCHSNLWNLPVYAGGPVETNRGWILHEDVDVPERREILPNLFLSGSADSLKYLLESGRQPLRLILGYAGWGAGQLEQEMAAGSWLTSPVRVEHILHTEASIAWKAVINDLGIDPTQLAVIGSGVH